MPSIHLSQIEKRFGTETIVEGIDLKIDDGEFVSLIGPSGCGKSTLLRLIAGLDSPSSGAIEFHSPEGDAAPMATPQRAFVFQDSSLLPWRSAQGNASLPLELTGTPADQRVSRVKEQLTRVGLTTADFSKLPSMLSGGMKMRVSLARALVTDPQVLLLDEPFGALDDILRTQLNDELLQLWVSQRWTTLFVTHQIAEAIYLSDRVVVMGRNPGTIAHVLEIPLERPRTMMMRGSGEFSRLLLEVQQLLAEVMS